MLDTDPAKIGKGHDIPAWLKLGRANPWIKCADDPRFAERSFYECDTLGELREWLDHGNWSLGQAFSYHDLCFINQVDGGDEWLTIRHGIAFESISARLIIERDPAEWDALVERLLAATPEQCRTLTY